MKRVLITLIFVILLTSTASAEIIITKQPKQVYNLGDFFTIPVTITSPTKISGIFEMNLLCNGHDINFYRNGVGLPAGGEKKMEPSLVLSSNLIGELKGACVIKGIFGEDYILTDEFTISNRLELHFELAQESILPGGDIVIEGGATKESGEEVNGFVETSLFFGEDSINASAIITHLETIRKGFFLINFSAPQDLRAGEYSVRINAYEKDLADAVSNQGNLITVITIKQVPTNLELVIENPEVEPGTDLRVKAILHDQTGENIISNAILTIKDNNDQILEKIEKQTDEFLEYPISYNEPAEEWIVIAESNEMSVETTFTIQEKADIKVELINKTLTLTNMGNVPYNDTVLVKIDEDSLNLNANLEVDEVQKFVLSAPDGEYQVEIITEDGSQFSDNVLLTGKSIDIKKASVGVAKLARRPGIWIFVIIILGFVAFTIYKKGYKRSFFGRIISKKTAGKLIPLRKNSIITSKSKAELSLSIKGDKQSTSVVCLRVKNLEEIENKTKQKLKTIKGKTSKEGDAQEVLQGIVDLAEEHKAATYENQNNLFFILAPTKTKTFKNEKTALDIAQKAKALIEGHNKLFKQKIDFGLSLNHGTIIAKQEPQALKFMSMGTLITTAKKIAHLAQKEIFLSEKIKEKLTADIKTEKHPKGKINVYSIKEIKHTKDNEKFIRSFLNRIEGKK